MTTATSKLTEWLQGIALGGLLRLAVIATPVPASRPRVSRNGGVFYPKSTVEFQRAIQKEFSKTWSESDRYGRPFEGPLGVAFEVRHVKPKSTKLPAGRGDIDNHVKTPFDVITKLGIWHDDSQITQLYAQKRWAEEETEEAGVTIWIGELVS